jgi:predicted nucleic acid-binding Zn ribbon protein
MIIKCPSCNREYQVDDTLRYSTFECECGAKFVNAQNIPAPTRGKIKKCMYCGEIILAEALKCKHCGEFLDELSQRKKQIDRTLYTILALFLGGIGVHNFYAGRGEILAGITHIIIVIASFVMLAIAGEAGMVAFLAVHLANCVFAIVEIIRGPEYS